ncbi:hypothetical protein [Streptomyces rapamycinicus]|uniref:Uncharacterized protein n=1 Tax=Streptomyces rapamycinicus TaxID=1226757 RepID=A0ABR6LU32_9ACTN|nr:hypothetical protein [Streptomyces rapamycinicus]AGP58166.1 hypothetical protein M271_33760 [Streptomyces rapamycinicus NRRL 5491]MBB4785845.1 hypothetical protein [Streptomyces rapamycinicus]UTO65993.1 hypothetical protein LJB45_29165 [Streptomyces rapamycinicus]UTP33947.1 hypothetical protein LIV37_34295 [Streptomyces rapamycinicus NRRL 5491]
MAGRLQMRRRPAEGDAAQDDREERDNQGLPGEDESRAGDDEQAHAHPQYDPGNVFRLNHNIELRPPGP